MGIAIGMIGKAINNPFITIAGFSGALLHTLNHSLFKSLLFFTAGNIYSQTHTRNMEILGGLIKKLPATAFAFLIGSLAIGGLPPFSGFMSEFLIYSGLIEGISNDNLQFSSLMIICVAGLAIVGGLSILTFTKTFGVIFLGNQRKQLTHTPHEVSKIMLIPLFVIIAVILTISFFPGLLIKPLENSLSVFYTDISFIESLNSTFSILSKIGLVSLLFFSLIGIIYGMRYLLTKNKIKEISPTWGCGYVAGNTQMQYSGKSFSKSLAKLFSYITIEKKVYNEIENSNIFPESRNFISNYKDFFEAHFISHFKKWIMRFIDLFIFIHNGKLQVYILYGLFFIITILVGTMLNLI